MKAYMLLTESVNLLYKNPIIANANPNPMIGTNTGKIPLIKLPVVESRLVKLIDMDKVTSFR
jgi:hypothetical protein